MRANCCNVDFLFVLFVISFVVLCCVFVVCLPCLCCSGVVGVLFVFGVIRACVRVVRIFVCVFYVFRVCVCVCVFRVLLVCPLGMSSRAGCLFRCVLAEEDVVYSSILWRSTY